MFKSQGMVAAPVGDACTMIFRFPYPINPMEEEAVRDMMTLIVVMLKNGASVMELQQRLMGLM